MRRKSDATKTLPRLLVTSREGATARNGSRPARRRRGIDSALVRVRRPHRQQAPSQRVCGRGGASATNSHLIRPFASADTSSYRAGENRESRFWSA